MNQVRTFRVRSAIAAVVFLGCIVRAQSDASVMGLGDVGCGVAHARPVGRIPVWIPAAVSPPVGSVVHLAAHPRKRNVVAAAGLNTVYLSRDGGRSWVRILRVGSGRTGSESDMDTEDAAQEGDDSDEPEADRKTVMDLAIGAGHVYVATVRGVYAGPVTGQRLTRSGTLPRRLPVTAVAVSPLHPSRVFAACGRWVYGSADRGNTWKRLSSPSPGRLMVLRAGYGGSLRLVAATRKETFLSADAGQTWKPVFLSGRPLDVIVTPASTRGGQVVAVDRHGLSVRGFGPGHVLGPPRRVGLPARVGRLQPDVGGRPHTFWAAGETVYLVNSSSRSVHRVDLGLDGSGRKLVVSRPGKRESFSALPGSAARLAFNPAAASGSAEGQGARRGTAAGRLSAFPSAWAAASGRVYRLRWVRLAASNGSGHQDRCGRDDGWAGPASSGWRRRTGVSAWVPGLTLSAGLFWDRRRHASEPTAGLGSVLLPSGFRWTVFASLSWDLPSVAGTGVVADQVARDRRRWFVENRIRRRRTHAACRMLSWVLARAADLSRAERVSLELQSRFLKARASQARPGG